MMRTSLLVSAALFALASLSTAQAETTVIKRDAPDDTVVVDRPASETRVETRERSDGCSSKTVSKENEYGDRKTVTKESCD